MRILLFGWVPLFLVLAVLAQQAFGVDVARAAQLFLAMPPINQFMFALIGLITVWLAGAAIWQAERLVRQNRTLHARVNGMNGAVRTVQEKQSETETVLEYLTSSDPRAAIASLQTRMTDTENRAVAQKTHNEAADIQERVNEIRTRQQALRHAVGGVVEKRRAIEPLFAELKERQAHIEQSLAAIEAGDNSADVASRVKDLEESVAGSARRLAALQDAQAGLSRSNDELKQAQAAVQKMHAPKTGIEAKFTEAWKLHTELTAAVDALQSNERGTVEQRVDALSNSKLAAEDRIARLAECYQVAEAIRHDLQELAARRQRLEQALGEAEVDTNGVSLADQLHELDAFAEKASLRLRGLHGSLDTLVRFLDVLKGRENEAQPLQDPVRGIWALNREVIAVRDRLNEMLDELEVHEGNRLQPQVEALLESKLETEQRVTQLADSLSKLNSTRNDISRLFTKLSITLDRHV